MNNKKLAVLEKINEHLQEFHEGNYVYAHMIGVYMKRPAL